MSYIYVRGSVIETTSFASAFGDFGGRIWLNAAHQGPLPRVAAFRPTGRSERAAIVVNSDQDPHRNHAVCQRLADAGRAAILSGALVGAL